MHYTLVYLKMLIQPVFAIFPILLIVSTTAYKSYRNYKVYSVHARDESDLQFLKFLDSTFTNLDFWDEIHHTTNTSYRVMVAPADNEDLVKILIKNRIENHLIIDDVEKVNRNGHTTRRRSGGFNFDHFWTYSKVNSYLDNISKKYPKYTKVSIIGLSGNKRPVRSIQIFGANHEKASHTHLLVDATIHAREWISTMMAVYIIHELVENRKHNLQLLDNVDWIIVPIVNPDGYIYTHEHDRFWRKTRTKLDQTTCVGVDINRNFDFHWNTTNGSSTNPCKEDYRGPKPSCVPEVENLSKLFVNYPNTKLYLTFHSYGGYILYPYGYDVVYTKNRVNLDKIGKRIQNAIFKYRGYKYKVGNSAKLLYAASGGSDDYAAGVANIPYVYTIELPGGGPQGFDIPKSRIKSVVKETFAGIKVFGSLFKNKK